MRISVKLYKFHSSILDESAYRVEATQLQSTSLKNALPCLVGGYLTRLCRNIQIISYTFARWQALNLASVYIIQDNNWEIHIPNVINPSHHDLTPSVEMSLVLGLWCFK